jgi:hypothetical protein
MLKKARTVDEVERTGSEWQQLCVCSDELDVREILDECLFVMQVESGEVWRKVGKHLGIATETRSEFQHHSLSDVDASGCELLRRNAGDPTLHPPVVFVRTMTVPGETPYLTKIIPAGRRHVTVHPWV